MDDSNITPDSNDVPDTDTAETAEAAAEPDVPDDEATTADPEPEFVKTDLPAAAQED